MRLYDAAGVRITKAAFPTTAIPAADLPKVISADLYERDHYDRAIDVNPAGDRWTLAFKAGTVLTQRQIDALFPAAVLSTISPAGGPAAGGTVVTIRGENLDGVTSVTFGGTAGTALTVVSDREIRVTTPAKAAAAYAVAAVDDSGTTTRNAWYTYA